MSHGINAEFISQTSEVFLMLHYRLYSNKVNLAEEIGGHSAFWIHRAQKEGCGVLAANLPSDFNKKHLQYTTESANEHLSFPVSTILEEIGDE